MKPIIMSGIFLLVMVAAAGAGMWLRTALPEHHTSSDSRDAVLRAVGLVVTLTALVLGFIVSSANSYYNSYNDRLVRMAADVSALDRILQRYGPGASDARELLRESVGTAVRLSWPHHATDLPALSQGRPLDGFERLLDDLRALKASDPSQAEMLSDACDLAKELQHSGLLLSELRQTHVQGPLLFLLSSWLVIIFAGFGLIMPRTGTAIAALLLSMLASAGSVLLILELYNPLDGLVRVSPEVVESALATAGPVQPAVR